MADTGSELLEDASRTATHVAERLLEHHFMLRRMERMEQMREPPPTITRTSVPAEGDYACTLVVTPAKGHALDLRAHEVLDALERSGSAATFHVDDQTRTITLSVPASSVEPTQRALERLQANAHSSFTLAEVTGLDALEEATGQRTLHPWTKGKHQVVKPEDYIDRDVLRLAGGGDHTIPTDDVIREAMSDESLDLSYATLTFASFPDAPGIDREHAKEYAARMRERGIDAHVGARRPDGSYVVAVTYPIADEVTFLDESVNVLHEIGALAMLEGEVATKIPAAGPEPDQEPDQELDPWIPEPSEEDWEPEAHWDHDAAWEVEPAGDEHAPIEAPLADDAWPDEVPEQTTVPPTPEGDVATPVSQPRTRVPKEHVMVVFASDTDRDLTDAQAYVRAMTERGYDPWHAAMGTPRGVRHTIELSYPADERERFAADHANTLEAIDALDAQPELDVLEEPLYQPKTLEELVDERIAQLSQGTRLDEELTADDYLALTPHERARIAPERIPEGAFGERVATATSRAREASRLLEEARVAERVPERVADIALAGRP